MERDSSQILGRVNLDSKRDPHIVTIALGTQENLKCLFFFWLPSRPGIEADHQSGRSPKAWNAKEFP